MFCLFHSNLSYNVFFNLFTLDFVTSTYRSVNLWGFSEVGKNKYLFIERLERKLKLAKNLIR